MHVDQRLMSVLLLRACAVSDKQGSGRVCHINENIVDVAANRSILHMITAFTVFVEPNVEVRH